MRDRVKQMALETTGFLAEAEGLRLYELAVEASQDVPLLEVGSYCGRSTLFLAEGCRESGQHPLFAIDHHHGSEEQQPGQEYFDPALYDAVAGSVDTLTPFIRRVRLAGLMEWVIPVVGDSAHIGRYWTHGALGLLFIDGGHTEEAAFGDYHAWSRQVVAGGYLCIHDIFPDPADGGQAPYHVLQHALASGAWDEVDRTGTLGVLRRR